MIVSKKKIVVVVEKGIMSSSAWLELEYSGKEKREIVRLCFLSERKYILLKKNNYNMVSCCWEKSVKFNFKIYTKKQC